MLDLTKLATFLYAAEHLSFSTAARLRQLSQPTVSHHIKALEDELGAQLFDRSGGRLRLTESGQILLPHARKLIRYSMEMEQMLESVDEQVLGHIRIACSTTAGKYILPIFAARFRQKHPGVRVSMLRCTPEHVVPSLLEAEANIGVVSYNVCGQGGLECQPFFHDHVVLIVPAGHAWATRDAVEPGELIEQPFLMREVGSGTRQMVLTELGKHDVAFEDLDVFLELGDSEAIVSTIEAGFGVSFVSHVSARKALGRGTVVAVPVVGFDLHRQVYMVQKSLRDSSRAIDAFWVFVHNPANTDLLSIVDDQTTT